jgi:hypothetical protein
MQRKKKCMIEKFIISKLDRRHVKYSYFKCDGGYKCLYYGFLCNDVIDCLDGTDENRDTCKSELVSNIFPII